jgi:hypothetical protein
MTTRTCEHPAASCGDPAGCDCACRSCAGARIDQWDDEMFGPADASPEFADPGYDPATCCRACGAPRGACAHPDRSRIPARPAAARDGWDAPDAEAAEFWARTDTDLAAYMAADGYPDYLTDGLVEDETREARQS